MAKGSGSKWLGRILIALFLIAVTAGLWVPLMITFFFEKDYSFPEVAIDATVQSDGDLLLEERRTFAFKNGDFTFAYFNVADPNQLLRDFSVSEVLPDGTERALDWSGGYSYATEAWEARWDYPPANDEERTFVFRYRMPCAVQRYPDRAHLYWQFIGTGWEKETKHATVTVHLPGTSSESTTYTAGGAPTTEHLSWEDEQAQAICPTVLSPQDEPASSTPLVPGDVQAWGHGPLNGTVDVANPPQVVTFDVRDVPPGNFVEGSILFPSASVAFAPTLEPSQVASIVADEERWAAEANALREQHRQQMLVLYGLAIALPVGAIVLVVISRLRDRVSGVPRTLSQPPEDDAVEVAFLFAQYLGDTPSNAYRAQLLRLVRIGAVELRTEGMVTDPKDITFVKRKGPEELEGEDRAFMELLFGAATDTNAVDEISIAHPRPMEIDGPGPRRYKAWLDDSKKDVSMAMINIEKGDARFESVTLGLLVTFSIGFAIWGATFGQVGSVGLWLIPWALVWLMLGLRNIFARIEPVLRERIARLLAFRRYLKDFSSLPNAPTAAVVIWERYLEWAVALGVADEVEEQVRALVPVEKLSNVWPSQMASSPRLIHTLNPVANSLVTRASTSISPSSGSTSGGFGSSSSSSGSSGGFSGGGGGGGGGTGGGAG